MTEKYRVEGELVIRAQAGARAIQSLAGRLESLRASLDGGSAAAGGLVRSLAGFAAGYVGINAIVGGMRSLVSSAVQYQQGLEGTRIGLAAVSAAVDHIPFAQAQAESQAMFETIQTDALRSVATSRELFDIYQSIYGPLRSAGLATGEIRQTMLDTVSAATALNIDLPQASRDIQMMARGAAGMEVRLFSMLRSTGAIAEDARAFNRLSQPERIATMQRALGQFSQAADAYGHSFAGVTSTFRDIVENLTGALFGASFSRLTTFLGELNDRLLQNRDGIRRVLSEAGEGMARYLQQLFDAIDRGMTWLGDHWFGIVESARRMVQDFRSMLPGLVRAGQVFLAFSAARSVLSTSIGAVAGVLNLAGALGTVGAALLPVAGGAAAGGAAAGAAGEVTAAGGGLAALESALAGLAPAFAALAAVFALVAGVTRVVYDGWESFVDMFTFLQPVLDVLYEDFSAIGENLSEILRPILTTLGTVVLAVLIPAVTGLVAVLRVVTYMLRAVTDGLRWVSEHVEEYLVNPFRDAILEMGRFLANALRMEFAPGRAYGRQATGEEGDPLEELRRRYENRGPMFGRFEAPAPTSDRRPVTVNDFRGSRISVSQEFRQADPDRILMTMVEDINRQAEARIQSGFVPALTR